MKQVLMPIVHQAPLKALGTPSQMKHASRVATRSAVPGQPLRPIITPWRAPMEPRNTVCPQHGCGNPPRKGLDAPTSLCLFLPRILAKEWC